MQKKKSGHHLHYKHAGFSLKIPDSIPTQQNSFCDWKKSTLEAQTVIALSVCTS